MIEQYVIDCIRNSKKPSGRRLSGLTLDYKRLYCTALDVPPPLCGECDKEATFISISKGFGKYCSKQCYRASMSKRNIKTNRERNKRVSVLKQQEKHAKYANIIDQCVEEYLNSDITIAELAAKYNVELNYIKKYFREKNLTSRAKSATRRRKNLLEVHGFNDINARLEDRNWVNERFAEGWTCRNFGKELGCCPNYISRFLKKTYPDIVFSNSSSYEVEIVNLLKKYNINYQQHSRSIIPPREIDIYLPDFRVGIEINGVYWHSNERVGRGYHKEKTDASIAAGIRLMHFTDIEIEHKMPCVTSLIKAATNKCIKIPARKCKIVNLTSSVYRDFCDQNHLQGPARASIRYGLMFKNEIVAVMSFAKPRFNKNFEYELIRYCCLLDHTVIGGPNKLFQHFIKTHKCESIISYSQRRLFTGNMYTTIGMHHLKDSPPGYVWINKYNNVLTRYQTQKHKLNGDNKSQSESQIMAEAGYYQIYDSGQKVYVWYK